MPYFKSSLYRDLIEKLPDAIVVVNIKGEVRAVNSEACELFGYRYEELVGQDLDVLIPIPSRGIHKQHVKNYFLNPGRRRMGNHRVVKALRKSGEEFQIDIILAPLEVEGHIYSIASCRDVSYKKESEITLSENLQKQEVINKELEKFSYTISHDLKAPLAKVQGLMNMMLEEIGGGKSGEDVKQISHYINESLASMNQMITDVLNTARKEKNNEEVHIKEVLEELYKLVIIPHNFKLTLNCDFAVVAGSKVQLLQVLLNLVTNAIKYNDKEKGEIELSCKSDDGMYQFCLSDNGKGVSKEDLDKIFQKFEKGSEDDSLSHGIGLATVKEIVEEKGGEIYAESELGKGTRIRFTWPKVS